MTFAKRHIDEVQVKRFVRSAPDECNTGSRKTLKETSAAVSAIYESLSCFSGPSNDGSVVENGIVEEHIL